MQIVVPLIINHKPSFTEALDCCNGDMNKAIYWYKVAKRVHQRTMIAESQNWKCCWCGKTMTEQPNKRNSVTREHIIPKSQGGGEDRSNIAAACNRCNSKRGIMPVEEFMSKYLKAA